MTGVFKDQRLQTRGQFLKKSSLSPLVILSMEKTMVTKVLSELKSISRLKIFRETGPSYIVTESLPQN